MLRGEPAGKLERRDVYAVSPLRSAGADALVRGDLKLIATEDDRVLELYDLAADPGELRNLAAERPETATEMLRALRALRRRNEERRQATLAAVGAVPDAEDAATRDQLKALGYLN
jgi:arylsulfatase A-like enzyme